MEIYILGLLLLPGINWNQNLVMWLYNYTGWFRFKIMDLIIFIMRQRGASISEPENGSENWYVSFRLLVLLQLHLHSRLNTCLQWIEQRHLQDETRNILILGFGASYIRCLTVNTPGRCKPGEAAYNNTNGPHMKIDVVHTCGLFDLIDTRTQMINFVNQIMNCYRYFTDSNSIIVFMGVIR